MNSDYYNIITNIGNFFDGIMVLDEHGKIKYHKNFNKKGVIVKEKDSIGKTPMDIFNITAEQSACYRAYKYGETTVNEIKKLIFKTGEEFLVQNNSFPIMSSKKIIGAVTVTKILDDKINKEIIDITNLTSTYTNNLYNSNDIIGSSPEILLLKDKIKKVSRTNSSILIYGETGTGKEMVAQSIHSNSNRKGRYFISQNCAAIPETLLESIFFGTTKGSYTGAEDKPGIFEIANGGTIFLDEINSMNLNMQAKLLKAIEEKKITRIGGTEPKKVDVRIIAAVNQKPIECINKNKMREDLYYRLSSIQIRVPPLRERKSDIPLLTEFFINYYNHEMRTNILKVTDEVYDIFKKYNWPGNVREFKNVIESAFNFSTSSVIEIEDLPESIFDNDTSIRTNDIETSCKINLNDTIESFEKNLILSKSKHTKSLSELADILEISKQNLNYKLKKHNIKIYY